MADINEQFNNYYSEYIQANKDKGYDFFELTNRALNYCMEKLGLEGRMPINGNGGNSI